MARPTLDDLLDVWTVRASETAVGDTTRWRRTIIDLLAEGEPVAADRIATATGISVAEAVDRLAAAADAGYEVDDQGRLVGAALTLNPTPHELRVRGNDLYAWCGFDTLFLPILLGENTEVTSTCPQTGQPIHLRVASDGSVTEVDPPTTLAAIVSREITSCCTTTGPTSTVCTQMPFLADPHAAEQWLRGRSGVAVVDLNTAARIARAYAGNPRTRRAGSSAVWHQ